jgi:CDP-diacylglycerol--serine O-phosphatidyltransferase
MRVKGDGPDAKRPLSARVSQLPTILSFVVDWANLITLLGLSSGVLAIVFALDKNYPAAIIAMLWAILFDWYDGVAARATIGRSESHKLVGIHMDSLVDLVSSGVVTAILLLSIGDFSPWFYPGALAIIMAGVLRLAYFDVFGVDEKGTVAGVTIDSTAFAVAAVFLFEGFLSQGIFAGILYTVVLAFAFLEVAPIRTVKFGGIWLYIVTAYVLIMTGGYSLILLTQ